MVAGCRGLSLGMLRQHGRCLLGFGVSRESVISRVVMALRVNKCFHTLEGRRGCPNILDYMP